MDHLKYKLTTLYYRSRLKLEYAKKNTQFYVECISCILLWSHHSYHFTIFILSLVLKNYSLCFSFVFGIGIILYSLQVMHYH